MKKLLSLVLVLTAIWVRAELPTITLGAINGSSSLTSPTYYSVTNSFFSFPGVRPALTNFNGINYFYAIGDTHPQGGMMPVKVAFNINAQAFEVRCFGGYPNLMVYNPPDYTPYTNVLLSALGQGYTWVRVQFASKASRNIIFYVGGAQGSFIGGVNVQAGDTISTNTLGPRKKLEILGDSYTEGYSQSDPNSRWLGGFAMQMERLFTNVDVIPAGVGGTGYSWPGAAGAGTTNYLGRFRTDVVSNNPDYLIINGGLNDVGNHLPTNVFQIAVSQTLSMAISNLPNTKIAVVGNFYNSPSFPPFIPPDPNSIIFDGIIRSTATSYGLPFIDAIGGNWLNANNYLTWMGNDSIHPTIAGYTIIASNIVASLPPSFSALQVTSGYYNAIANGQTASTNTAPAPASATFSASPGIGGAPLPVHFSYTGTNGSAFAWAFGDGGTSTLQNPTYTYAIPGTFTVNLAVNGSVTNSMANLITVTNTTSGSVSGSTINVTNYGAVGDAVQFFVNTKSNSVLVTTTNVLPTSAIGDVIEIMQAGPQTYGYTGAGTNGYGNEDLIATITNIVMGTNIYINFVASNTLNSTFATYGHNNTVNIQNAINAASTNTVVFIPAGTYLLMPTNYSGVYGFFSLLLQNGGMTISGAGADKTRLLDRGAWQNINGSAMRGAIFEENPPIANHNLPFTLENLTLDGGVQTGNTRWHGYPASNVDGNGWGTSDNAFMVWSLNGYTAAFDQMIWTNVTFQHFRAEMVISLDGSTNGNLLAENCTFNDGNATAFNIYPSLNFTNCLFNNCFQVAEYYQAYSTNTCYFQDNVCSNITGNEFALNGGKGNNPYFVLKNNTFYLSGYGNNGIETTPADNVVISNNTFVCQPFAYAVVLGVAGYQGTFDNSNIVIAANTVINANQFVQIASGSSPTDPNRTESVSVTGNILTETNGSVYLFVDYGWSTNIVFSGNNCSQFNNLANSVSVHPSAGYPYAKITTDNLYYTWLQNASLSTNVISYGNGSRYYSSFSGSGSAYVIQNSDSNQIPAGAQIYFNNQNSFNIPLYLNSVTGPEVMVTNGMAVTLNWTNRQWVYPGGASNGGSGNPVIQVSPGSLAFGSLLNGTSLTSSFLVQNVGGGTLSGMASVAAPFSITSGGTYNLAANQSQLVYVGFSPTVASNYNQSITLTGGNGASVIVSGTATNSPSSTPPVLSAISANVSNLGTNPAFLIVKPGALQLSASASAYGSDGLSWQWGNSVNGGSQSIFAQGTGTNPVVTVMNTINAGGNTNLWTLKVTDSQNGLSAQSQITLIVMLPPPQGVQVSLQVSGK